MEGLQLFFTPLCFGDPDMAWDMCPWGEFFGHTVADNRITIFPVFSVIFELYTFYTTVWQKK